MHDEEPDDEDELLLTRTRAREQGKAYLELAEQLAKGKHERLPDPPFDGELREAVADAQRFVKNARSRQIRRVAQLLRAHELDDLHRALAGRTAEAEAAREHERLAEGWRARLLDGGDAALTELLAAHPEADRQRLRQLVRAATRGDGKARRAATELLRAVRELVAGGPAEPANATDEPE